MSDEAQMTQEGLLELDRDHDLKFEEYLNSRGWRSIRKSSMHDSELDTSADTSGSFHGDNPRYNLFPDSTDRLDSFDGEVDRLSDLSFRTSNTHPDDVNTFGNYLLEHMQNANENGEDYDQVSSSSEDDNNWNDITDSVTDEYEVSAVCYDERDLSGTRVKHGEYVYRRTDENNRIFSKKILESTKVSHSDTFHGIPLNPKDSLENYNRRHQHELNSSNVDRILHSKDPMFAMSNQPRTKFHPSTVLDVQGIKQIKLDLEPENASPSVYFKSNLSATYCKNGFCILVVAVGAKVRFYDMSRVTSECSKSSAQHKSDFQYLGVLGLEFPNTTNEQIENSVNPNERYSINYITIKKIRNYGDYDVLAVCNDYSQVIILDMKEILTHFFNENLKHATRLELFDWFFNNEEEMVFGCSCVKNQSSFFRSTFQLFDKPIYVNASAWCVDICDEVIAVSDNQRRVTVFVQTLSGRMQRLESPILSHNIPYLNIVRTGTDHYLICCGTYGSHQYILSLIPSPGSMFEFRLRVIDVIETDGPVWTCNFVKDENFMSVNSLKELTGDLVSDLDGYKLDKIITQSAILDTDQLFAKFFPSHLGINAYFTHLNIPSITSRHFQKKSKSKTMATNEVYQLERIRKIYNEWYMKYEKPYLLDTSQTKIKNERIRSQKEDSFLNYFLVTTTTKSVGLFLLRELVNLGTCKQVFPIIESPYIVERPEHSRNDEANGETDDMGLNEYTSFRLTLNRRDPIMPSRFHFLNRIYMSFPILQLNAIVIATQAGQVAVFRLTRFNGMHSMRLESVLIDAERYAMSQDGSVRSIIGLTGCVCGYDNNGESEWMLIVVYSDLLTLNYKICKNKDNREKGRLCFFNIV